MEKSIELDCAPGPIRPGDLIGQVVEGLGLEPIPKTTHRTFGEWRWDFPHVSDEHWTKIQPMLKERISKLYQQCLIRYGSW